MRLQYYLSAIILVVLFMQPVYSQVSFGPTEKTKIIGKFIKYYVDSTGNQDIRSIKKKAAFIDFKTNIPDMGVQDYPVWLKIEVVNNSSEPVLMLQFEQSFFEQIDFYYPVKNGYKVNTAGERYAFGSRMMNFHKYIYELKIPNGASNTYYVRLQSSQKLLLPISVSTKENTINNISYNNLLFGIFFGIIIVMFFYNLFIYFTVNDPIYLYYVVYILVVGLTQATIEGYTFQYLWPNNTFLATRAFFFLTAFVNISGLEFVRKFLHIRNTLPFQNRIFFFFYAVYIAAITLTAVGFFDEAYIILQVFAGIVSLYILAISIYMAKTGYRPAKFFLVAWLPLITGIIIYVLREFAILPYNNLTNYSITIGTTLEVILLSFALADKINVLKEEKEKSQEETLHALQENSRIIREQNVILEISVKERTKALEETNSNLNDALVNLKEAQSQLVDSEKMASLGQLTAGIAHEINNPINFVTSNIKPLELDINDLNDVISKYEALDPAQDLNAQLADIESFKRQIDIKYIREEIKSLLSGIGEGAKRTAEIIRSLKNFSRLDEIDSKPVNLNEGLASTLVLVKNTFPDYLNVVKDLGEIPIVECLPGKINQVFMNLITNAVQAIVAKGSKEEETLSIKTWFEGEHVKISIKDSGTGMPEEVKQKIFEPFFTTKDVGEGTGLGLSIVFRIIENHQGNIEVITNLNQGTEFIITLPINRQ